VHRYEDGVLTDPDLASVRPGDHLLVKSGEIAPVDGRLESASAVLDLSSLVNIQVPDAPTETGSPVPAIL
jgi:cation transport ATPase